MATFRKHPHQITTVLAKLDHSMLYLPLEGRRMKRRSGMGQHELEEGGILH